MNLGFHIWFRAVTTGLLAAVSLIVLNVVWWKAFIVGAIAYLFCVQRFGVRWIERIAFVLALFAICVWIEALPPAHDVKVSLAQFVDDIRQAIRR